MKTPASKAGPKMARISNPARAASICVEFEKADTASARSRGLMFRQKPLAILFVFERPDRYSIHSFFVPFEFDAVYLDQKMRALEIYARVRPFVPLLTPQEPASYLLELPPGDAQRLKLTPGDQIKIGK